MTNRFHNLPKRIKYKLRRIGRQLTGRDHPPAPPPAPAPEPTKPEPTPFDLAAQGIAVTENERRLLALKNRHQGRRCFVIGNGPSLRQTNLDKLKDEITIGCNGIFLLFDETAFRPTYYTVEDRLVAEDRASIINTLDGMTKVLPIDLKHHLKPDDNTVYINFLRQYPGFPKFTDTFESHVYFGGTVTYLNLQLARYLGCDEIYLVGVDHNYQKKAPTDKQEGNVITSTVDDVNHFHPDYFGPGYRWHDPRVDRMEQAYLEARRYAEANGFTIYNATIGGALEVFPRVDFDSL